MALLPIIAVARLALHGLLILDHLHFYIAICSSIGVRRRASSSSCRCETVEALVVVHHDRAKAFDRSLGECQIPAMHVKERTDHRERSLREFLFECVPLLVVDAVGLEQHVERAQLLHGPPRSQHALRLEHFGPLVASFRCGLGAFLKFGCLAHLLLWCERGLLSRKPIQAHAMQNATKFALQRGRIGAHLALNCTRQSRDRQRALSNRMPSSTELTHRTIRTPFRNACLHLTSIMMHL